MPSIQKSPQNHVVNHLGVAVPDHEAAVEWYTRVLGFRKLQGKNIVSELDREKSPGLGVWRIYGTRCNKFKLACLTTGNGVGFELFEFIDPPMQDQSEFSLTRGGVFPFAITAPDPEVLATKVIEAGGSKIGETIQPFGPTEDDEVLYLQDPWGNVIEVVSCSFEQLMANKEFD